MIRIKRLPLSAEAKSKLSELTKRVEAEADETKKKDLARDLFENKENHSWQEIKSTLRWMNDGRELCYYCLYNEARDIDHMVPLALHPASAFDWRNYANSCSTCNGEKGDQFPFYKKRPLLILPTKEDPCDYFEYTRTGELVDFDEKDPGSSATAFARHKSDQTVCILDLNRGELVNHRRDFWGCVEGYLEMYLAAKSKDNLDKQKTWEDVLRTPFHLPLLAFMWRFKDDPEKISPELAALVSQVPEIQEWIDPENRLLKSTRQEWDEFLGKKVSKVTFDQDRIQFAFEKVTKPLTLPCQDQTKCQAFANEVIGCKLKRYQLKGEVRFIFKSDKGPTYAFYRHLLPRSR